MLFIVVIFFSLLGFLPIIIFLAQWSIYIALIADQSSNIENFEICANQSDWRQKLIMFGACGLYFVKSFFMG